MVGCQLQQVGSPSCSSVQKKMAAVHLPQYLANLAQPVGTRKAKYIGEVHLYINSIVCGRLGVVGTFLCVFMSTFTVFVR